MLMAALGCIFSYLQNINLDPFPLSNQSFKKSHEELKFSLFLLNCQIKFICSGAQRTVTASLVFIDPLEGHMIPVFFLG